MDSVKQQIIERIKQGTNVLVTVSNNPTVDQLAACIGLTLMLNKLGKHATAVYSGETPPIMEFLEPEKTIEKTTDSLRDFIIAIDKSKADKLRYKVEDTLVKIFITPYKTSISEKDLVFSEGDFNVDVIVALGVHNQAELDQAIAAHGRILHDATVISINDTANGSLGSLNLLDQSTSSLCELLTQFDGVIGKSVLDAQISTALLTGIVAETNRFSNDKTTAVTMNVSSKLLAAGANQQLVSLKLEEHPAPPPPPPAPKSVEKKADDREYGVIQIRKQPENTNEDENSDTKDNEEVDTEISIDSNGTLRNNLMTDDALPEVPASDEKTEAPASEQTPPLAEPSDPVAKEDLGTARNDVETAIDSVPPAQLPPIQALNAQSFAAPEEPLVNEVDSEDKPAGEPKFGSPQLYNQQNAAIDPTSGMALPPILLDHPQNTFVGAPMPGAPVIESQPLPGPNAFNQAEPANQPPPVPPPMMPFSPGPM